MAVHLTGPPALTPRQMREVFGTSHQQILRWADQGIAPYRLTPEGLREFALHDIEDLANTPGPAAELARETYFLTRRSRSGDP